MLVVRSVLVLMILGIAIIPESLIAVLTITMVVGMTQMRKRKVVIRQLSALYVHPSPSLSAGFPDFRIMFLEQIEGLRSHVATIP